MKHLLLPLLLCSSLCQASLCESGHRQSPINITAEAIVAHKLPPMQPDYRAAPLKLANDGHTVRVRFAKSGELVLGKEHYTLQQFHFHTPGGDQINGENFPFAAHILHKSRSGQLLAIVVPFRVGAENPLLKQLMPFIPVKVDGDHSHANVSVNARDLLPKQLSYYRYTGSLTAAPCTEGVQWLVMKQPLELSAEQLAEYKRHFADNMRGVNPLYQRPISESE
ncbi:carbonic anhydrase family protein [Rhodoferax sp.]|uniref:carbonic anhydrase n=1 Tax=Rhodoferax sp. TaxID=50421 RepID=UPI002847F7DD|nr:carbonic anhydrase family protein [Rhodoferax sp.]MDR3369828.1 carbonic anhydrase family protein [Rhodoferax sp.]